MAMAFYVRDSSERYVFEIDVESPGYGYVHLTRLGEDGQCDVLEGARLGHALDAVTRAVITNEGVDLPGLYRISACRCRELLP